MSYPLKRKHPILIAEIGGNHEGDYAYANKLTDLAIEAGVDFIKYQLYSGDTLVSRLESPDRNAHFKKFELSRENYISIAKKCIKNGVRFMASVWDPNYIDWIDDYIEVYKIGSGDLTAYPVIKKIAQLKKPIILSTGLATLEETIATIDFIQSISPIYKEPNFLGVLQCTSMYPISYGDANLNVMTSLRDVTGLTIGYSDHTEGTKALEVAIAMGAEILEFHFTDTREGKQFRDHKVSLTLEEVHQLKSSIKDILELKGAPIKNPLPIESDHVISFRRAIYPSKDIQIGKVIEEEDLIYLRPNHGIDAREYSRLIGKTAKVNLKEHQKLDWSYFD